MIVDDSTVINEGLQKLLSDIDGLEIVSAAEDGLQAITDFSNLRPDLVILDLMIPKMSGLDVLRSCLLYTSPSPRDRTRSRMPSSA